VALPGVALSDNCPFFLADPAADAKHGGASVRGCLHARHCGSSHRQDEVPMRHDRLRARSCVHARA
jgi:hypothetical protein